METIRLCTFALNVFGKKHKNERRGGVYASSSCDVQYETARALLGNGYSIISNLTGGLRSMEPAPIREHVKTRFEEARNAGNIIFTLGGAHLTFPTMESVFSEGKKLRHN